MSKPKFEHNTLYQREWENYNEHFLRTEIYNRRYNKVMDLDVTFAYSEEPVPFEEMNTLEFKPLKIGEVWAKKNFACAWFHVTGKLPKDIDKTELYFDFSNDGEGLLVDKEGSAVKGFTCGSPTFGIMDHTVAKRYYPLAEIMDEEGNIDVYIDGASNGILGEFLNNEAKLIAAGIVRRDPEMDELFINYDLLVEFERASTFDDPKKAEFIEKLRRIRNAFVYEHADACQKGLALTREMLAKDGDDQTQVTAIGHAHLDLAWLWPIRESKRKAKRTFANAIYLLKKYPDFKFVVSQPQQLEWIKEIDPKQYAEIQRYVAEGRIETAGGGWVENDTNLPCGESLVRQELYGQKFWLEEFGRYVKLRWLPDTFGYSASMPQILRQSGQEYFMTIKLSWSNRTLFPYHSFHWIGIDGSEMIVHMPPEGNYNSKAGPVALMSGKMQLRAEDPKEDFLMVYGIGDGGGGPSEFMVERCLREEKIPYLPKVKMGTAISYFEKLKDRKLPVYEGEMYLEKHRGTYTSQSNNKKFNREFEEKMLSLEQLIAGSKQQGDKSKIDKLWKEALLYQFHDIIPGSSIPRVYEETDASYAAMFNELETMALDMGASFVASESTALINFSEKAIVKLEKSGDKYLYFNGDGALIAPTVYDHPTSAQSIDRVETDYYTVEFDADGSFKAITLKENGGFAATNANKLRVFRDFGDAWDFEDDYRDQPEQYMQLDSTCVRDFGELVEVKQQYSYKSSRLAQTIVLHKHDPIIRVYHEVDWKDTGYMLRSETLPSVWDDTVHSDIQFGYLDRSTTDDTEHEVAQHEICALKWFDVSGENQGFAVLNNVKSGYMAKQGILSLNLLRSTNYPCVDAEHKHIQYSYAFYPHTGSFDPVKTDKLAGDFNACYLYGKASVEIPTVDVDEVVVAAFKPAYDGNGYILRLYERAGKAANANLRLPNGYEMASEVNLLEDEIGEGATKLSFKPFEIRSFRIFNK